MRRLGVMLLLLVLVPLSSWAAEVDITVTIPQINVSEYHRPYVAVWIEDGRHQVAANLAVWYELHNAKGEGAKWLNDLRQWWRRAGRSMSLPVDGVTGATRPVGQHQLHFSDNEPPLDQLAAGDYTLVVEAVREVGGRELLRIPFQWPAVKTLHRSVQGKSELGDIDLDISP